MKYVGILLLFLWSLGGHAELPAQVIALNCLNCHSSSPDATEGAIPNLQRLSASELHQFLLDFKYDRKTATLMPRIAKGYSDTELAAVAQFLVNLKP